MTALGERGPFTYTGEALSSLVIEARGFQLSITGVTPLRDSGGRYVAWGSEYRYLLEGAAAEALLAALRDDFSDRPEITLVREFEFSKPHCPLREYLDSLGLPYEYRFTEGEPL